MSSATRYLCPVDGCGWQYDVPESGPTGFEATTIEASIAEAIVSLAEEDAVRVATEKALRDHLATHGVTSAEELEALLDH